MMISKITGTGSIPVAHAKNKKSKELIFSGKKSVAQWLDEIKNELIEDQN
ncbi:hypothetical protein LL912_25770 [Niabella sp. CC-SYL272]|nr:hypothetical protein [Niabella agricola]MCF3112223.1 hypothetical protein [Niabella agricola]